MRTIKFVRHQTVNKLLHFSLSWKIFAEYHFHKYSGLVMWGHLLLNSMTPQLVRNNLISHLNQLPNNPSPEVWDISVDTYSPESLHPVSHYRNIHRAVTEDLIEFYFLICRIDSSSHHEYSHQRWSAGAILWYNSAILQNQVRSYKYTKLHWHLLRLNQYKLILFQKFFLKFCYIILITCAKCFWCKQFSRFFLKLYFSIIICYFQNAF